MEKYILTFWTYTISILVILTLHALVYNYFKLKMDYYKDQNKNKYNKAESDQNTSEFIFHIVYFSWAAIGLIYGFISGFFEGIIRNETAFYGLFTLGGVILQAGIVICYSVCFLSSLNSVIKNLMFKHFENQDKKSKNTAATDNTNKNTRI